MGLTDFISSLCEYESTRIVRIKDKRLACLYYALTFAVLVYIVGFTFILKKRYLQIEQAEGVARVNWEQGKNPTPIIDLPYCQQNSSKFAADFDNYKCVHWDAKKAVFPLTEQAATLLTTRATISYDELNCSQLGGEGDRVGVDCDYTPSTHRGKHALPVGTYYVANPEDFTVLIDHSMFVTKGKYDGTNNGRDLVGLLVGKKQEDGTQKCWGEKRHHLLGKMTGSPCTEYLELPKHCSLGKSTIGDILTLGIILQAAGISSLDVKASMKKNSSSHATKRFEGVVLYLEIQYTNLMTFDLYDVEYSYKVHEVPGADFKALDLQYSEYPHYRALLKRHGVRIIFSVTGTIGFFDFQTALINTVTGFALLAVGTAIVDVLATKLLPQKAEYSKWKYVDSAEITGDVRDFLIGSDESENTGLIGDAQMRET
jgi:hypothetical protein